MNNIEVLEKYISFANKKCNFSNDADYKFHKELAGIIENLIKEYKELKNKCNELNFKYTAQWVDDNYIPKSKVEEKLYKGTINEINFSKAMFKGDFANGYIQALQELLEGE